MATAIDLRAWAHCEPARPALAIAGQRMDYGGLEALANRLAHVFRRHGLARGDHVVVQLPNCPTSLAAAWAAWRAGVYLTPLSTALSAHEAAHIVHDCEARLAIVDAAHAAAVPAMRAKATACGHWLSHGGAIDGLEALEAALARAPATPLEDESPGALMMYTAGTTGAPKGVWRPLPEPGHRGPAPFAADLVALFGFDHEARYLSTAPLYHAAPLRWALAMTAVGAQVHAMTKFDAATALELLARERITHSQWVPTMFQRLLRLPDEVRRDFAAPAHRAAIHAAAPCPVPVKRAMIDWWGPILLEYYAGSEGVGLTALDSHEWLARPGSVGRARKGVARIVDDDGRELPAGEVGRVYFSDGPRFEYFKDPAKTATRTLPNGWQSFGDIGRLDAEGYLFLTDRADDTIISGGVNVYPQEIEQAILELDAVADCGVVGVEDPLYGERPVAFVVPAAGQDAASVAQRVEAHCAQRLGRIKRPDRIRLLDALPRSPTGKLLRRELRRLVAPPATASP